MSVLGLDLRLKIRYMLTGNQIKHTRYLENPQEEVNCFTDNENIPFYTTKPFVATQRELKII
ncbi:hypothetical protein BpHYR1_048284 [Brachionus plicatilis]|uniref:Uncharacterized protein n=1 Tax=Brachionus plicatilis TaxID=10195 RepID=A0A3M7QDN5_BRAPC|nr:hypothetical protein BpHYR1_048284 [Brachionus plicatilis]